MVGLLDLFNMSTEASAYDVAGNPIVYNPGVDRIRGAATVTPVSQNVLPPVAPPAAISSSDVASTYGSEYTPNTYNRLSLDEFLRLTKNLPATESGYEPQFLNPVQAAEIERRRQERERILENSRLNQILLDYATGGKQPYKVTEMEKRRQDAIAQARANVGAAGQAAIADPYGTDYPGYIPEQLPGTVPATVSNVVTPAPVNAAEQALKAGLDGGQAAAAQNANRQQESFFGGTIADILSNPFVQGLLERFRDPAFQQPGFAGQGLETLARGFTAADYNVRAAEAAARAKAQEQAVEIQKELVKAQPEGFKFSGGDVYKSGQALSDLALTGRKIARLQEILASPAAAVGGIAGGFDEIISDLGGTVGASGQTPQQKYTQIRSLILSTIGTDEAGGGGLSRQDYQLLKNKLPEPSLVTSKQKLSDALKEVSDFIKERQVFHRYVVESTGQPAENFTTPKPNPLNITSKEIR